MKYLILFFFLTFVWAVSLVAQPLEAVRLIDLNATLGEGALWDYRSNRLLFVDIEEGILYAWYPESQTLDSFAMGQKIGTVVPASNGDLLVALKDGIYSFNPDTRIKTLRLAPESAFPDNRFNDGKCSPEGRFWVGSMSLYGKRSQGNLYSIEGDFSYRLQIDSVTISNGIVWSSDTSMMYYTDTPVRKIAAYSYQPSTGDIRFQRYAIVIPDSMGAPDGSTIDADGNVWVALWGGSAVACYNPHSGKLLRTVHVPARNVTSCAFGGADLDILFITTASAGKDSEQKARFPNAGDIFWVKPGVKGVKAAYFQQIEK